MFERIRRLFRRKKYVEPGIVIYDLGIDPEYTLAPLKTPMRNRLPRMAPAYVDCENQQAITEAFGKVSEDEETA